MKIEEAIDILSDNHTVLYSHGDYTEQEENEALNMAIKSLEAWESVREEIKFIQEAEIQVYGKANWNFSGKCLDVIDKHLAEVSE